MADVLELDVDDTKVKAADASLNALTATSARAGAAATELANRQKQMAMAVLDGTTVYKQLEADLKLVTADYRAGLASAEDYRQALAHVRSEALAFRAAIAPAGANLTTFTNLMKATADNTKQVGFAAANSVQGLGRMTQSLGGLASSLVGVSGPIGNIAGNLLQFGAGNVVVIGFLAGFAAMTYAMKFFGRAAEEEIQHIRDLHAEADKLRETAEKSALVLNLSAATTLKNAQKALRELQERGAQPIETPEGPVFTPGVLESFKKELFEAQEAVKNAQADVDTFGDHLQALRAKSPVREGELLIARQKELNESFGQGALIIGLINARYDLMKANMAATAQLASGLSDKKVDALKRQATAVYNLRVEELQLEGAEVRRAKAAEDLVGVLKRQADERKAATEQRITVQDMEAEAAAELRLAAAKTTSRAEEEKVRVALAGEAAVRAELNKLLKEGGFLADAELARIRAAAEARERGKIAVENANKAVTASLNSEKQLLRQIQNDFSQFFADLFTNGISSFEKLFTTIRNMFLKLIADLVAQRIMQQIVGTAGGASAGGAGVGLANAGAAAAAGGALGGPIGIGIGLAVVAAGAIVNHFKAAAELARQIKEDFNTLSRGLKAFQAAAKGGDDPFAGIADEANRLRDEARKLRDEQIKAAGNGREELSARIGFNNTMDQILAAELEYIERIKEEQAVKKQEAREDLNVRLLRAQGNDVAADAEAFRLQQQREWNQAVKDSGLSLDDFTNSVDGLLLSAVQAAEAQRRLIELEREKRQAELETHKAALEMAKTTADTLRAFALQLRIGNAAPGQSIELARQQFDMLAARARAGDQDAARQLPGVGQQLLDLSRQYNASGAGYQSDLRYVLGIIDQLGDQYEVQKNLEQEQVDILQKILDALTTTNTAGRGTSRPGFTQPGGYQFLDPNGVAVPPAATVTLLQAGMQALVARVDDLIDTVSATGNRTASALERVRLNP